MLRHNHHPTNPAESNIISDIRLLNECIQIQTQWMNTDQYRPICLYVRWHKMRRAIVYSIKTKIALLSPYSPFWIADCPAMSFVFVCWQINITNTNQLSWAINYILTREMATLSIEKPTLAAKSPVFLGWSRLFRSARWFWVLWEI